MKNLYKKGKSSLKLLFGFIFLVLEKNLCLFRMIDALKMKYGGIVCWVSTHSILKKEEIVQYAWIHKNRRIPLNIENPFSTIKPSYTNRIKRHNLWRTRLKRDFVFFIASIWLISFVLHLKKSLERKIPSMELSEIVRKIVWRRKMNEMRYKTL